ncbi:FkbM family methyltransferase [Rhodococcus antarcticus]|uniref:FkbM family methyltransferase n=1 Tax=Rhodococcus antarcticus TaxID=2987751 RepID=A0ABY6NZX3_9NOCA|nr:FkbM family methyltransferase [Rhodococcus antarcticus]UZJ24959.1 FkbM family methyltransferase [Rhodococcus antarcticus]
MIAQRFGIDVIRFDPRTADEIRLATIMTSLDVEHVIDVGANVGQFALTARGALGFTGRIDSFEPGADAFEQLQGQSRLDPGWFVHRLAVTDVSGPVTLNVFGESDLSSLSLPSEAGREAWKAGWRAKPEVVDGERLDQISLPALHRVFLKIDTQGHDWNVIESARGLLDRVVVLMTELSLVTLYETSIPAAEVIRRLDAMGFTLANLVPVNRVVGKQYLLEADGIFIRREPGLHSTRSDRAQ